MIVKELATQVIFFSHICFEVNFSAVCLKRWLKQLLLCDSVRISAIRFEPSVVFHITDVKTWQNWLLDNRSLLFVVGIWVHVLVLRCPHEGERNTVILLWSEFVLYVGLLDWGWVAVASFQGMGEGILLVLAYVFHSYSSLRVGGPWACCMVVLESMGLVGCWGQAVHWVKCDPLLILRHEKCPSLEDVAQLLFTRIQWWLLPYNICVFSYFSIAKYQRFGKKGGVIRTSESRRCNTVL